jgi:hypothetical protein
VSVIEKISLKYPDLFQTDGTKYGICLDVLEQIAEEMEIQLSPNYSEGLIAAGYQLV